MTDFIGQESQTSAILNAYASGKMHHGWLLAGPQGLGKAGFARAAAAHILTREPQWQSDGFDPDTNGPAGGLLRKDQHPDCHILTPGPKDDKELRKAQDGKPFDLARSIRISQIRELLGKLTMQPSYAERRVIIIDSVDLLERNAANALLKTLEEPPRNTILLLVSHNPGKLLPTIRSRCITLKFNPLPDSEMQQVLRPHAPDMDRVALELLAATSDGSPGRALEALACGMPEIQRVMQKIAATGDADQRLRLELVAKLKNKANRDRMAAFVQYAPVFAARTARSQQGRALPAAIAVWEELSVLAEQAPTFNFTPDALAMQIGGLLARLAPPR